VFCPYDGEVAQVGYNPDPGDYGYCVITRHVVQNCELFMLFGHLSKECVLRPKGTKLKLGDTVGFMGDETENGGWPSHVHFQLSYQVPTTHDLIGVCSEEDREKMLKVFPDPQLVLGKLY
jgi:hypothetical protein